MSKRVALHNLGCKVNAYELDKIAGNLKAKGYEIVPFSSGADAYVVNTCTVTHIADRKSRQMLHRAKKNHPEALVVAIGCYVDTDPAGVAMDPSIDLALSNSEKEGLPEVLDTYFGFTADSGKNRAAGVCDPVSLYRSRTRAYVKVQDGCNLFCSYCVIPYARGRSRSFSREQIMEEVRMLASDGVREVVLTGIHLSSFGLDDSGEKDRKNALARLVHDIDQTEGIGRIRLGSLEPRMVTERLVDALASAKKLCPHFHLSLQSGCDSVLKRMRRRYTTEDFAKSVALLRNAFDNPALTSDLITGFPGESEREFEECRRFVDAMDFYETHVFPFSARKGTAAFDMEGQLSAAEKAARSDILIRLSNEKALRYRTRFLNSDVNVLFEERAMIAKKKCIVGHTERYIRVACGPGEASSGEIKTVRPSLFLDQETLFARPERS